MIGTDQIVRLAAGQVETDRIARSIGQCVDLTAQSATGASDCPVRAGFFFAPALY
jgi:hypothetical protein